MEPTPIPPFHIHIPYRYKGRGLFGMNKYWPKEWEKALPNFLGEDFFSSFEQLEKMDPDNTSQPKAPASTKKNISSLHVNVYESGHELLCVFKLPGLKLKEVDIDVYDQTIEVKGSVFVEDNGFRPISKEIFEGPVERKVKLPYPVRSDKIDASYHHGYLFILLHRLIRANAQKPKIYIDDLDKG
jgi:HSP20 family protein